MAEENKKKRMYFEGPDTVEAGRLRETAKAIANWVISPERLEEGPWVAGVYGPRGSGKTSLLLTVLDELRQRKDKNNCDIKIPLCDSEGSNIPRNRVLFSPSDTRDHDNLFFLLLDFLESYGSTQCQDSFKKAREEETRRHDFKSFLEYEQETSASIENLKWNLVECRRKSATSILELSNAFRDIFKDYTNFDSSADKAKRPFLLLVDDLDLKPDRAYELLELLRLFFAHSGVVVLVAADSELLAESIRIELDKKGSKYSGLPHAMLAKLIPYQWDAPVPDEEERFSFLWNGAGDVRPELPNWWDKQAAHILARINVERSREISGMDEDIENPDDESLNTAPENYSDTEASAEKEERAWSDYQTEDRAARISIRRFLPTTYRNLKAFHNLLTSRHDQFAAPIKTKLKTDSLQIDAYAENRKLFVQSLGLPDMLVFPFLTAVAAMEVEYRELNLLAQFLQNPDEIRETFTNLSEKTTVDARSLKTMPVFEKLQPPWVSGRRLGMIKNDLTELARLWEQWQDTSKFIEIGERFLSISLDADAKERGRELWKGRFDERDVDNWHLDLREFKKRDRAEPQQLLEAQKKAKLIIDEKKIAEFTGPIEMLSRAPLSLVCQLGWHLRHMRRVTAYNDYAGNLRPFTGPREPLRYEARNEYNIFEEKAHRNLDTQKQPPNRAILIIDLFGISRTFQTDKFFREPENLEKPLQARIKVCLKPMQHNWTFTPNDLLPALEDVYECINRIRIQREAPEIHLGLACPDIFAFFLGRELNALGDIHLYEFYPDIQGGSYLHVFRLSESG